MSCRVEVEVLGEVAMLSPVGEQSDTCAPESEDLFPRTKLRARAMVMRTSPVNPRV